jgi:hypothetical protein
VIASVHVADVGASRSLGILASTPKPAKHPGLRSAIVAGAAKLGPQFLPRPDLARVGMIAFWDDDAALDRFLADDPLAAKLESGWRLRLAPLRAHGTWPGLDTDVPTGRKTDHEGPAAVLTLGRMRMTQAVRFLRTTAKAEGSVVGAPGLIWASGFAKPPVVATCSLWEDERALSTYAYGAKDPAHRDAITEGDRKLFHKQQAFIRFRPYDSHGSLAGKHPLPESWMTPTATAESNNRSSTR